MKLLRSSASSEFLVLFEVLALASNVWFSARALLTWGRSEMLLSFSILRSSKEESVCAYYNI